MYEKIIGGQVIKLYSTSEAAELLGVRRETILRYVHQGRLCGTKLRWSYHFAEDEIIRFLTEPPRMDQPDYRRSRAERQGRRKDAQRPGWENTESLW